MKILLISDVVPSDALSGGHLLLYRHFVERDAGEWRVIDFGTVTVARFRRLAKLYERLRITRLGNVFTGFYPLVWPLLYRLRSPGEIFGEFLPDVILTVAHDRSWLAAEKFALAARLPLCSVFHDWYPDAPNFPRILVALWDRAFRRLYRSSKVAFCVSEPMMHYLGDHPGSVFLPPIPNPTDFLERRAGETGRNGPIRLIYAGYCGGFYHKMLERLLSAISKQQQVTIDICGVGSEHLPSDLGDAIRIHSNLAAGPLQDLLRQMDGALVILPFDPDKRRHLELHFPSKLTDLVGRGIPVIVWGPSYSAGIQWAKKNQAAITVSSEDPNAVLGAGSQLRSEQTRFICKRARETYEQEFEPEALQQKFLHYLEFAASSDH